MSLKPTIFIALLALPLAATSTAGSPRDNDTKRFLTEFPEAKFVEDDATHRYYIVHDFIIPTDGNPADRVVEFALAYGSLFGLSAPGVGLTLDRIVPHRGDSYLHFDQTIDGKPVFGAKVIAHLNRHGEIIKISSTAVSTVQQLRGTLLDPTAATLNALAMTNGGGQPSKPVLGYLPVQGLAIPIYQVIVPEPGPHLWSTYVDAVSGAVLLRVDGIRRHQAEIFTQNPVENFDTTLVTLENIATEGEHAYHTYGDYVRIARCNNYSGGECTNWDFLAEATDENGFLDYEPVYTDYSTNDGFAEVQTYWALDTYYGWLRDEFGFAPQFVDAESMAPGDSMWIYVNIGFENGFFQQANDYYGTPDLIMLGQGEKDFAYDNDVSRHEFTHALSSQAFDVWMLSIDSMGPDFSGQAVEEGTADFFPCSMHNSSMLAEFIGIGRNLDNDYHCPENLWGEGHHDGQIMGGALWEIRTELGARKAEHIQYGALASNSISDFRQWSEAIKLQAYIMTMDEDPELQVTDPEFDIVEDILAARNLDNCIRAVPIEHEDSIPQLMPYPLTSGGTPSAVQYVISTDANTEVIELGIEPYGDKYNILMREGEPIEFTWTASGYDYSWEAEYDFEWIADGEHIHSVKISNLTEWTLNQNTDYYFSIICLAQTSGVGCQNLLSATLLDDPDTESDNDAGPDAGYGDTGNSSGVDDSGCDCRVGPGNAHHGLITAVLDRLL